MHRSRPFLSLLVAIVGCGTPADFTGPPADGLGEPLLAPDIRADGGGPVPQPIETNAAEQEPRLRLSEQSLYFGQVCEGAMADKLLVITNTGGAVLRINSVVTAGDGFSMANRPDLPHALLPGQRYDLTVRFASAASQVQPYEGQLRIVSNDPRAPTSAVRLGALSLPGTLRASPRLHDFGTLRDGSARSFDLTLTNAGECPILVGSARVSGTLTSAIRLGRPPESLFPGDSAVMSTRLRCSGEDSNVSVVTRLIDREDHAVGSFQLIGYCAP